MQNQQNFGVQQQNMNPNGPQFPSQVPNNGQPMPYYNQGAPTG